MTKTLLGPKNLMGGLLGPYAPMGHGTPYGLRGDGTAKGRGFLGLLSRPDGNVSSEISASTDAIGGRDFPLMVPTLTPEEVKHLLSIPVDDPAFYQKLGPDILMKAEQFAIRRVGAGLSPFAGRTEEPPQ